MENFEPRLSFGILSSRDFFEKLEEDYKDFDKNHLSPRYAINCALTSWHLTDWTYSEFFKQDKTFKNVGEFQKHIITICPELEYMRLIANGSKHCILRDSSIKHKTKINEGDCNFYEYNRHEYNVDVFVIEVDEKTKIEFEAALLKTINFWRGFLESLSKDI